MLVFIIGAVIWGIGAVLKAPIAARMTGLVALWGAVVLAHLLLPANSALRLSTGGSAAPWLLFGGFVGLALLYARGLKWLRARRDETAPIPAQTGPLPIPNWAATPATLSSERLVARGKSALNPHGFW